MSPHIAELARLSHYSIWKRWAYDWKAITADLGIEFPAEYKEYVSYFPPGRHGSVIEPMHPALRAGYTGLSDQIKLSAELFTGIGEVGPNVNRAISFYPATGGLIPWAAYESVAVLCWLPDDDDPDRWPVVAYSDENAHERIPGSTVEALIVVLRGDAGRSVFPTTFYNRLEAHGDPLGFEGDEGSPLVELPPFEYLDEPEGQTSESDS